MNLIGASGHAKVIIDILKSQGIDVETLYDENENITEMLGKQVIHHHNFASPLISTMQAPQAPWQEQPSFTEVMFFSRRKYLSKVVSGLPPNISVLPFNSNCTIKFSDFTV